MILFYAAENKAFVEDLQRRLAPYKASRCSTIGTVEKRLRKPGHGLQVVLMIVRNNDELDQICVLHHLVRDVKLVLVLPARDSSMVAQAHKLGPRFIAYADNCCDQVGAVLDKMMRLTCETAVAY